MVMINSWGTLKAELARYMFHQRFQPDYDTATQNFEALANRRLRTRMQETWTPVTTVNGDVALPIDYLLWRTVLRTDQLDKPELNYTHPAYLNKFRQGEPRVFTIEGSNLRIRAVNDAAPYEFHYFQRIPSIVNPSNDGASNWLIQAQSDLYLEGVLFELFALGRNGDAAMGHKQLRDEKFAEVIQFYALTTGATAQEARETAEYY